MFSSFISSSEEATLTFPVLRPCLCLNAPMLCGANKRIFPPPHFVDRTLSDEKSFWPANVIPKILDNQ